MALLVQNVVGTGAVIVSLVWLFRALPRTGSSSRHSTPGRWLAAALPLGAVDLLRQVDGSYGVILVGLFSNGVDLGVFRVAVACAVVAAMPVTVFHVTLAPKVAQLHHAGEAAELQRLLSWSARAMVVVMLPIAVAAWFMGRLLISWCFGAVYADAWFPLFLLTCSQLIYAVFGMGPIVLAMCNGERALIRIYLVAVAGAVAAAIPLTIAFGGNGAAAASIISAVLIGTLSRRNARQSLGLEISALPPRQRRK